MKDLSAEAVGSIEKPSKNRTKFIDSWQRKARSIKCFIFLNG